MKSKTLKEKISDIVFSICAGGVIYLIVGYLMKTNWLSCPKPLPELYEIVRDTLTLMAYFLAPAIALVLFSDWRQEHIEKSREQQGEEIYKLVNEVNKQLNIFHHEICDEDNHSESQSEYIVDLYKKLLDSLNKLEELLSEFDFEDEQALAFKSQVKKIVYFQKESVSYANLMYSAQLKVNNPEFYNFQYKNYSNDDFIKEWEKKFEQFQSDYVKSFDLRFPLVQELKPLKNSIKVKATSPN